MRFTELSSPTVRKRELPVTEFKYDVWRTLYLPTPSVGSLRPFLEVTESRKTVRKFNKLSMDSLSELLWYTAKTKLTEVMQSGYTWQHRASPSAGGRHPIDILVVFGHEENRNTYLYGPLSHTLNEIRLPNPEQMTLLVRKLHDMIDIQDATILLFAAQFCRTLARYKDGESLVWRDSGALLATMYVVAEAIELNCCGIGITGEKYLSRALESKGLVVGVGGCIVGAGS